MDDGHPRIEDRHDVLNDVCGELLPVVALQDGAGADEAEVLLQLVRDVLGLLRRERHELGELGEVVAHVEDPLHLDIVDVLLRVGAHVDEVDLFS